AQPFVAAIIAHTWFRLRADDRQTADSTIWILCPSVHSQESFYESLVNWQSDALLLPEAEFAAAENVLPDPEIVAERLAVLMQIGRGTGPGVIVATGQVSSKPHLAATRSNLLSLSSGAEQPRRWKTFSSDLSPPATSGSPKSPPEASSPSAAALSIFIHGKRPCRCGWNFSAIRSNHCASST